MPIKTPDICNFGWPAPHFTLLATDGKTYTLGDISGENGTLIMFICNHCPYVLAVLDKIIRDAHDLMPLGIGVAAICSNDPVSYPNDSFENMRIMAERHEFPFPYLHDADQLVAKAYDAVCTPDYFGFNKNLELQYRGRLDSGRVHSVEPDLPRELYQAMVQIKETGKGPEEQFPSMGCSIKWAA